MLVNQLIKDCLTCKKERPRFHYLSPFLVQTKQIAWDYAKHYASVVPGVKFNESELRIDFPNCARLQLLGADNPDRLRGIYSDGVALDEYPLIKPNLYSEVIRPALADRQGYSIFSGTPKGKNHFWDLLQSIKNNPDWYVRIHKSSETGYIREEELIDSKRSMTPDEYEQEWECSFEAAIKGAFYGDELLEAEKRITGGVFEPALPVNTAWDIGYRDDTAIIFFQLHGKEIRIVDFYSNSGMTIAEYAGVLKGKSYRYDRHFFPWDAKIKPMSSGKSTLEVAREYGIEAEITPNLSVLEGINQARLKFPRMYFDKDKTKDLVNALSQYHREWNDSTKSFRANPLHDWTSHAADAFRYMAISIEEEEDTDSREELRILNKMDIF
jgi:hypothetical protein